ncbi:MAG: site-specific integrase [Chloroherpetonaceae bacterium]
MHFFSQLVESKKQTTAKAWKNCLTHLRAWRNGERLLFKDLTKATCAEFRLYLEKLVRRGELKGDSANVYIAKFKAALRVAVEYDLIPFNPSERLKAFPSEATETAFLTVAELSALAHTEPPQVRGYDSKLFATFLLFLARTGVRPCDAKAFCWSDIQGDIENGFYIDFKPSKTRNKGVKLHRLYLHHDAVRLLFEHRERQIGYDIANRIFIGLPPENSNCLNEFLRAWSERAGIKKHLTVYSMRHTHATNLLEAGNSLYAISKVLAHTTTKHTERYAHLLDVQRRETVNSLPSLYAHGNYQKENP